MNLVLDTGILGQLVHPRQKKYQAVTRGLERLLTEFASSVQVFLPEIADYELRRKLLHLLAKKQTTVRSIERLDELSILLDYLPLETHVMRNAAQLWADARLSGEPTAPEAALDGDVILAAQALDVGATVVTSNVRHLDRFVPCKQWPEIEAEMASW